MDLDLVSALIYLAPGFLALKIVDLFGAQRRRSQWEWTTWSVVASLPVNAGASELRELVGVPFDGPRPDGWEVAIAMLVAVAVGGAAAIAWRGVRGSSRTQAGWLRRELTDSAWDQSLEDAVHGGRALEVVTEDGDRYRGQLRYAGREAAGSAGWFYLFWPDRHGRVAEGWSRHVGTHGLLLNRDKLRMIRVYLSPEEDATERREARLGQPGT